MCKYILTKGVNSGKACAIKGKDEYYGFCKRHFERSKQENFVNVEHGEKIVDIELTKDIDIADKKIAIDKTKLFDIDEILDEFDSEESSDLEDLILQAEEKLKLTDDEAKKTADKINEKFSVEAAKKDFICRGLFNMNVLVFNCFEALSISLKENEKIQADLEGLTADIVLFCSDDCHPTLRNCAHCREVFGFFHPHKLDQQIQRQKSEIR